jgi:2-polyprenyl-3-methyl-5-hydroxy-6-metoxy-1,4-benzoquinol methylase
MSPEAIITKNPKYRSKNPISRYLVKNYFRGIGNLLSMIDYKKALEVGCGEGIFLHNLSFYLSKKNVTAVDIDPAEIEMAEKNCSFADCFTANAYNLPFKDKTFDLVFCCEVLEHLEDPQRALKEILRISSKYCILSVPNEPLWRILNMVRGAFFFDWGNTPGHLNHWSPVEFKKQVSPHFQILESIHPLPWTGLLCKVAS